MQKKMKFKNCKIQRNMKKQEKGITLIALVITIIVLLILAAVSIATLTGENGILTQARIAKEKTDIANVIEQAKTDILGIQTGGDTNITQKQLKKVLSIYFENVPDDVDTDDTLITQKKYGGEYRIAVSDIYDEQLIKGLIAAVITEEQKKELYGKYVTNYECDSNGAIETAEGTQKKWMIFNIDGNNIYLIASDYINTDYCPTVNGVTVTKSNSYPRGASFDGIFSQYTGSISITDNKLQALNSSYFNYLTANNTSSINANMKSVAFMMDTNSWSGFAGEDAEYAIGGPTIELLFESFNAKYTDKKYQAQATGITGYQISTDGGNTWKNYTNMSSEYLKSDDKTYVINSLSNAYAMWLASPSNNDEFCLLSVFSDGGVAYGGLGTTDFGFRPIVCLKSDVELRNVGDNTYEIIK